MTMKLNATMVQYIRDLARAGFSPASIAGSFGVSAEQVRNIITGRAWAFVPDAPGPLPIITTEQANRLKPRQRKLTAAQQRQIEQYRQHLVAMIDGTAEREGLAVMLLSRWTPRKPNRKRSVAHVA